jgi:hypothetical protein
MTNLQLRLGAAIAMTSIAVVSLTAQHLFGTMWSNHCDPGNERFNLLKYDPVVAAMHPPSALITWENDGPDNSWMCSGPSLSVSYIGNTSALYDEVRAGIVQSGWSQYGTDIPGMDFAAYEKDLGGGVVLSALVNKDLFWVEIDLDVPGLHLGESGFQ